MVLTGEDDLYVVRSAVADLAGRWQDFGISLGMRSSDLGTISSNHPPNNCFREMLTLWLRQTYNVCTKHIPHAMFSLAVLCLLIKGSSTLTGVFNCCRAYRINILFKIGPQKLICLVTLLYKNPLRFSLKGSRCSKQLYPQYVSVKSITMQ